MPAPHASSDPPREGKRPREPSSASTASDAPPPAGKWGIRAAAALLVLAALAAWRNSFSGALVFDDTPAIVDNPTIRRLWPLGPILSPGGEGGTVGGRPVVNLSLAVNHALGGTQVAGYHILNLAIHILAGLTLFGLVRRTLAGAVGAQPCCALGYGRDEIAPLQSAATPLALAITLLWTVHPLQTESVTYVVQRAESLMGLFYLLTLYCFSRALDSPRPHGWQLLSWTACLLGMATKEVMASAPLVVLLYDRTFAAGSFREAWRQRRWYYAGLAATWMLLAFLVVRTEDRGGSAGFETSVAWWAYALTQCRAIIHYLRLSLWPHPLVFDYGDTLAKSPLAVAPQAALLALLLAGTVFALWRRTVLGFLGAWFFLILAPSSSIVPIVTQTMAEHRMYLPLAAVIVLVVAGVFRLLGPRSLPVFALLALGLGWATALRNQDYRSEFALWNDTRRKWPDNARAHNNVGSLWLKQGELAQAMQCFTQALQLKPDYASAHYNLGIALADSGRPADAIAQFQAALRRDPNSADLHVNLGVALLKLGRAPDALPQFETALRLQPGSADVQNNLGLALAGLGRTEEAIEHYREALRVQPDLPEAHVNLGDALQKTGRVDEAIHHYQEALRVQPDRGETHLQLAAALAGKGDDRTAEQQHREALRLQPDHLGARFALGNLLARAERFDEAIAEYRQVLRLDPGHIKARNNLGNALLVSGRVEEAIGEYEEILRRQPDNASVRENLRQARALLQTGKRNP